MAASQEQRSAILAPASSTTSAVTAPPPVPSALVPSILRAADHFLRCATASQSCCTHHRTVRLMGTCTSHVLVALGPPARQLARRVGSESGHSAFEAVAWCLKPTLIPRAAAARQRLAGFGGRDRLSLSTTLDFVNEALIGCRHGWEAADKAMPDGDGGRMSASGYTSMVACAEHSRRKNYQQEWRRAAAKWKLRQAPLMQLSLL